MSETDYPVRGVIDITRIKSTTGYISRFQVHDYPRCFKLIEQTESLYHGTMKITERNVVCFFLLGNSPASEFCVPTFQNTVCSIFIGR
jgi:hypothetical protein